MDTPWVVRLDRRFVESFKTYRAKYCVRHSSTAVFAEGVDPRVVLELSAVTEIVRGLLAGKRRPKEFPRSTKQPLVRVISRDPWFVYILVDEPSRQAVIRQIFHKLEMTSAATDALLNAAEEEIAKWRGQA